MRMPVLDGREASRRIKAAGGKETIIIALSASSFQEDRPDVIAAGCDDFMRKPIDENELFALIKKHFGLTYVYKANEVKPTRKQVDSAVVATLPDTVKRSLEEALIQLDHQAVDSAIAEIGDAALAHALEALADEFQYGRMLRLIKGDDTKGRE
jgi:CheY-like chemotaxis protein